MADVNLIGDINANDGTYVKETGGGSSSVLALTTNMVGIGTTSPGSKLVISPTGASKWGIPTNCDGYDSNAPIGLNTLAGANGSGNGITTLAAGLQSEVHSSVTGGTAAAFAAANYFLTHLNSDHDKQYTGIMSELVDDHPGQGDHVGITSIVHCTTGRDQTGAQQASSGDMYPFWGIVNNEGHLTYGVGMELDIANNHSDFFDDPAPDAMVPTVNSGRLMAGLSLTTNIGKFDATRAIDITHTVTGETTGTGLISSVSVGSAAVTGNASTKFDTELKVGDWITIGGITKLVQNITGPHDLTTDSNYAAAQSNVAFSYHRVVAWDTGIKCVGFANTGLYLNSEVAFRKASAGLAPKVGLRFGKDLTSLIRVRRGTTETWGLKATSSYLAWESSPESSPITALAIDTTGRVGIGTTAPSLPFEVVPGTGSSFSVNHESGRPVVRISDSSTEQPVLQFLRNTATTPDYVNLVYDGSYLDVQAKGLLVSGGNVGIGTTNPAGKLHLYQTGALVRSQLEAGDNSEVNLTIKRSGATSPTSWEQYIPQSSTDLRFYNNNGDKVTFQAGGAVGIGTTSPNEKLDVNGNIKIGASDYFYLGASDTDGSWRFHRSGNNLRFERRESGVWNDKGGFNA